MEDKLEPAWRNEGETCVFEDEGKDSYTKGEKVNVEAGNEGKGEEIHTKGERYEEKERRRNKREREKQGKGGTGINRHERK